MNRSINKKANIFKFACLLTAFAVSAIAYAQTALSTVAVENLRCEYLTDPVGIDILNPRFSWELVSAENGKKQKAYRIMLATDSLALTNDIADVYDSHKIAGNQTAQITYAGNELKANTLYFWKVCVWDERGKRSAWSPVARFYVGILSAGDWKARWIGEREYPLNADETYYPFAGFNSRPVSGQDSTHWVAIDLGELQTFDAVKIYPPFRGEKLFPPRFTVEVANSADFSDARIIVNETSKDVKIPSAEFYYKRLDAVKGRYIRMNVKKLATVENNAFGYGLAEIEILRDMENIALNRQVTTSETTWNLYSWKNSITADGRMITDGHVRRNNIYFEYDSKIPPSPVLRKEIRIGKKIKHAFISASARGIYELYINGQKVGKNIFAPEYTAYDKHHQYQTYDVGNLLVQGSNALGAMLADGWYSGSRHLSPGRGSYGAFRQFIAQMTVTYDDNTSEVFVTDDTWKIGEGPVVEVSFFGGETYDASREQKNWNRAGFNDSHWQFVPSYPVTENLCAQMNEPIAVIAELKPVEVHKSGHNRYVFDMGQNMVGWCSISLPYNPAQPLRMRYAEMLHDDGTIYIDNLRDARPVDVYRPAGEPLINYEPRFTFHGFRYVEVDGLTSAPEKGIITGKVVSSAAPETGYFETSDKSVNKLWENIRWTQRGNQHSIPTDCPQRDERLGWMADAQIFSQTAIYNLDMAAFYTKWTRDIRDSQYPDGRFTDISPFDGAWKSFYNSPGWADAGVIIPWRMYQNYNDTKILAQQYEAMKKFVDFNEAHNPDLIWTNVKGGFGDWLNGNTIVDGPDNYPRTGAQIPDPVFSTAYFVYSTRLLARSAKLLGNDSDFRRYSSLAEAIRKAFVDKFVSADGKVEGDTQAGYAMALQMELVPENLRQRAVEHLIESVKAYDYRMSTGFHTTIWMMNQLCAYGHSDIAYRLLTSRRFPSWFYSIDQGATTLWERWDGYVAGRGFQDWSMNSFNHVAFGSVGEWMYSHILGIRPDENQPGYRHFFIRPVPNECLEWAKGSYHSISGNIEVSWTNKNRVFTLDVTVPVNTEATVILPNGKTQKVGSGKHRFN